MYYILGDTKSGCRGVHLDFTQLWSNDSGMVPNSIQYSQKLYVRNTVAKYKL